MANKMNIRLTLILGLVFLSQHSILATFTPDVNNYDAYGVKIAMTDSFLVLATNAYSSFFVQYGPFNGSQSSLQCYFTYANVSSMFVYTVVVGKKQAENQNSFYFAGEEIGDSGNAFVGMAMGNSTLSSTCDSEVYSYSMVNLAGYGHQEYFILGAKTDGSLVYGFTNQFLFIFNGQNLSTFDQWNGNLTWPDPTFIPHAVDISDTFGVIAGFVRSSPNATTVYNPIIYLFNFNTSTGRPTIVAQYKPDTTPGTWQALLTNTDADLYSPKYDMSVSINNIGDVLVGMQFLNRVFLFSVQPSHPVALNYVNRNTNGRSIGNGKSIAWVDDNIAAVMVNTYSLNYKWSLSQVFLYDIKEDGYYNSTSVPISVFPNSHQILPQGFGSTFLNIIISASSSMALLNDAGQIIVFSSAPAGYYPYVQDTATIPVFTTPRACMAGTYKNKSGVHDCILCPTGTKNDGSNSHQCVPCLSSSFCPLGSVADVHRSILKTISQVIAYPQSPESIIFDEILIHNMFTIGAGRCILVSPLFWALVVTGLVLAIIIIMEVLRVCIKHPHSTKARNTIKYVFKHTDLIGEGEYWVGGLASFSVIVLVSFSYAFSAAYLKQYPIETTSDSYFACDLTLRNAKFATSALSLAIPFSDEEQEMVDLLDAQSFTMTLDLINTVINCDAISLQGLEGSAWVTLRWTNCNNTKSVLTLTFALPMQFTTVTISVDDTGTIGGLRFSLHGHGHDEPRYSLKDLNFYRSFSNDGQLLSRTLPISLALTKVINETQQMGSEESDYSAIFIPTFTFDSNSLFITRDQYARSSLTATTFSIVISETTYYVKNLEQPIAQVSEIVFRNLLFTVVCLEIFGLVFLFYKLIFIPFYFLICRKRIARRHEKEAREQQANLEFKDIKEAPTSNGIDENYLSFIF